MTNKNLFHNTSLRLTAKYLLIIMTISLLFSVDSYRNYARETDLALSRPVPQAVRRLENRDIREYFNGLEGISETIKRNYQYRLIVINVFILIAGGLVSYYFARRTLRPIEEAHEAQSRFTADASHELRTPITAMRVETELTLTDPKLSLKKAKAQLESNIEELDKLTSLSEGLLQLARVEGGELTTKPCSLDLIVESSVQRVLKTAEVKKQIITVKGDKNIQLKAHEASLIEALVAILDNAAVYSPAGSEIVIAKNLQLGNVELSITDKGPGIKPSDQKRIFERFYRGDSSRTSSSENGYGIGLSLAKAIVVAHGGSISVKSSQKKGSTFTLTLPQ